jgi:hypothetical protein
MRLFSSVIEDKFPLINNTGVWPTGCLIAPFYGKLILDQVYSSSTPVTGDKALHSSSNGERRGSLNPSPEISKFFIRTSGDLDPNVVGSQTVFTLLITKFAALLKPG